MDVCEREVETFQRARVCVCVCVCVCVFRERERATCKKRKHDTHLHYLSPEQFLVAALKPLLLLKGDIFTDAWIANHRLHQSILAYTRWSPDKDTGPPPWRVCAEGDRAVAALMRQLRLYVLQLNHHN